MRIVVFLFSVLVLFGCQTAPKCGLERRAAFDVGSGATKLKVVELNTCSQELTQVILEEQVNVEYRDALEKDPEGNFSEQIQAEGMGALAKLQGDARAQGARKFAGIATAAFRQAKNADGFVINIREKLGIPLRIISQSEEALLGFQAARESAKAPSTDLVVWDIGGGSMQMVSLDETLKPTVYKGELASVSFKNQVITQIQKKDPAKVQSPNPLTKSQIKKALILVEREAEASVPAGIKKKFEDPQTVVIGVGGVFAKSLSRQIPGVTTFTQEKIFEALQKRTGMTDEQLKDPFSATDVTNIALVYGYMKSLGIKKFQVTEYGLVDALWFDPAVWKE